MSGRCRSALLALLAGLLLLGGCSNSVEINDMAFVMGIGVDKGEDSGFYEITAQIARVGSLKSAEGDEDKKSGEGSGYLNISGSGLGIQTPVNEISRLVNRELYTGHNKIIVISKEVAQEDISYILDYFIRSAYGRFTISLLIAEGKAADVLEYSSELESLPSTYLQSLIDERAEASDISKATIVSFLTDMLNYTTAPTIPIVELVGNVDGSEGQSVSLNGMAVFKGATLCDLLTPRESKCMMTARNDLNTAFFPLEAFGGNMNLKLSHSSSVITPIYEGGEFKIKVGIKQEYTIAETTVDTDFLSIEERAELAEILKKDMAKTFGETLAHTRKNSIDIFGFGELLHRKYPRQSRDIIENWEEEYPMLEVDFDFDISVLSTGAIIRPLRPGAEHTKHK